MRIAPGVLALVVGSASLVFGEPSTTYIGVITDTMCVADHRPMKVASDATCVRECVRDAKSFQYALLDGTKIYRLSDQETPRQFAARQAHNERGTSYWPETSERDPW